MGNKERARNQWNEDRWFLGSTLTRIDRASSSLLGSQSFHWEGGQLGKNYSIFSSLHQYGSMQDFAAMFSWLTQQLQRCSDQRVLFVAFTWFAVPGSYVNIQLTDCIL